MFFVEVLLVEAVGGYFLVEGLDFAGLVADGGQQRVEFLIFDSHRILILDAHDEVGQHVHVVGKGLEGSLVGRECGVR